MKYLLHFCSLFFAMLLLFSATSKTHACTGPDIVFTNISITSIVDGTYSYSFEIKNIGTTNVVLGQIVIQNYVSTDDQVGNDAPAGGAYMSYLNKDILSPGETYSGTYQASPFSQNPQSSHPYLISQLILEKDEECDVSNNYYTQFIQVSTSIQNTSSIAGESLNWDVENKSFIVSEKSGRNSELQYSLYNTSGMLVLNGITQMNESTYLRSLNNGVYILHLSDGEKVYAKKITY